MAACCHPVVEPAPIRPLMADRRLELDTGGRRLAAGVVRADDSGALE